MGVIGDSRISKLKMDLKTKENFDFLKKHFLKYFRKGDSVLDCGVGPLADYSIFFSKEEYKVTGIEISKTTLKYAKKMLIFREKKFL